MIPSIITAILFTNSTDLARKKKQKKLQHNLGFYIQVNYLKKI